MPSNISCTDYVAIATYSLDTQTDRQTDGQADIPSYIHIQLTRYKLTGK